MSKTKTICGEEDFVNYVLQYYKVSPRQFHLNCPQIQFAVLVNDEDDSRYYVKYLLQALNSKEGYEGDSYDFLKHKYGVFMIRREEDLIDLSTKATLVSAKMVAILKGEIHSDDPEEYRKNWHRLMSKSESRMSSRFREDYRIFTGQKEQAVCYQPGNLID